MQKTLTLIPTTLALALAILFYPTTSNSNSTGSPGGKTGSPNDIGNCMACHSDAQTGQGATITTNIPSTGYEPGNTYNITIMINTVGGFGINGFEVTCEENTTNSKAGSFGITNPTSTQFTNNGSAVTHTTGGNNSGSWSFNWVAPIAGTGNITFYGAFIEGAYPMGNSGDLFSTTTLSFNEAIVNSTLNPSKRDDFIFNLFSKTIESSTTISVYDIKGELVLTTNSRLTDISHLNTGIYILRSEERSQKIILN